MVKMNSAYALPLTTSPVFTYRQSRRAAPHHYQKGGIATTEAESYKVHIPYTFNAFCKIVIRHAAIDKILKLLLIFHLGFTVPDLSNPVIYSNQKLLYDALYHAASATISELAADSKHLGAKIGYICILYTWGF